MVIQACSGSGDVCQDFEHIAVRLANEFCLLLFVGVSNCNEAADAGVADVICAIEIFLAVEALTVFALMVLFVFFVEEDRHGGGR